MSRPKIDPNWPERLRREDDVSETETTDAPEPSEPETEGEETNGDDEEDEPA